MGFYFIIGVLAGLILGLSITAFIMISIVKKANDWGDCDGADQTVESFVILEKKDGLDIKKWKMPEA